MFVQRHHTVHVLHDSMFSWSRLCLIEESAGERIHRDISRLGNDMEAARVHTWSAHMRVKDNFSFYDKVVALGRANEFHMFFKKFKLLMQTRKRVIHGGHIIPKRCKTMTMMNRIYRQREFSTQHFGKVLTTLNLYGKGSRALEHDEKLKLDYLSRVLKSVGDDVLTLPRCTAVPDAVVDKETTLTRAVELLDDNAMGNFLPIQVLEVRPERFNFHGHHLQLFSNAKCPMILQKFEIYGDSGVPTYPLDSFCVFPSGDPDITDVINIAPWPVLRVALRRWQVALSVSWAPDLLSTPSVYQHVHNHLRQKEHMCSCCTA